MKILSIVGARPNFMKIAPIISAINNHNSQFERLEHIEHILVHTGQHYNDTMSDLFFRDLDLPKPDIYLGVGSASHANQTAEIMKRFEKVLLQEKPDVVIVVGDVNSTLACALVASKIQYPEERCMRREVGGKRINSKERNSDIRHLASNICGRRPLIAHVEAGLRSFDRTMPEEINRILTDRLSDFLFVSEPSGIENLKNEGFNNFLHSPFTNHHSLPLVAYVGNTMIDTLLKFREKAKSSNILYRLGLVTQQPNNPITHQHNDSMMQRPNHSINPINPTNSINPYAVLTLHRPSNVDNKQTFKDILKALNEISNHIPIIFPAHPRTLNRINEFNFEGYFKEFSTGNWQLATSNCGIHCVDPLGYIDFLALMSNAKLVLTDSGGMQEETTLLGIPCVTMRENTERPITVTQGTNVVVGIDKETIITQSLNKLNKPNNPITQLTKSPNYPPLWDGLAAHRIINTLINQIVDKPTINQQP